MSHKKVSQFIFRIFFWHFWSIIEIKNNFQQKTNKKVVPKLGTLDDFERIQILNQKLFLFFSKKIGLQ